MDEYKVILENGLYLLEGGMSLDQWVPRMMAWTSQWTVGVFNFTDLNEAHRIEDRVAVQREMAKLIAQCDAS